MDRGTRCIAHCANYYLRVLKGYVKQSSVFAGDDESCDQRLDEKYVYPFEIVFHLFHSLIALMTNWLLCVEKCFKGRAKYIRHVMRG